MASPTSVRHQPSATGFQAVAVVAAMTITTAITMGAHAAATQPSRPFPKFESYQVASSSL
jgi:hypothetical protein